MENSGNKQFVGFKLHAILSSRMQSHTILLSLTSDMNHPFVQRVHILYITHQLVTE